MAAFKDACFHYRRITKLNRELLRIGANSTWTPAPPSNIRGWCLECCQLTNLTYCYGCSLHHVCQWCVQYGRCFLDDEPHLLRLRTVKSPITTEKLASIVKMYQLLFPINHSVVKKFIKSTKQHKCRNDFELSWYNQLVLPITLTAAAVHCDDCVYYIFGHYEGKANQSNLPYRFVNCVDEYDKLLLDDVNFDRMAFLPERLQKHYAKRYFIASRTPSAQPTKLTYSDFSVKTLINSGAYARRRIIYRSVTDFHWQSHEDPLNDLLSNKDKILAALMTNERKPFLTHNLNLTSLLHELSELVHHAKPCYLHSFHIQPASKVRCRSCSVAFDFHTVDWRIRRIYDDVMYFLRACCRSNVSAGSCSSLESTDATVKAALLEMFNEDFKQHAHFLFHCFNPVEVDDVNYILFNYPLNYDIYNFIMRTLATERLPFTLSCKQFTTILFALVERWYDLSQIERLPLSITPTNRLIELQEHGDLAEEFDLLLSSSDSEED
nr:NSP1 [Murine rotavirus]